MIIDKRGENCGLVIISRRGRAQIFLPLTTTTHLLIILIILNIIIIVNVNVTTIIINIITVFTITIIIIIMSNRRVLWLRRRRLSAEDSTFWAFSQQPNTPPSILCRRWKAFGRIIACYQRISPFLVFIILACRSLRDAAQIQYRVIERDCKL